MFPIDVKRRQVISLIDASALLEHGGRFCAWPHPWFDAKVPAQAVDKPLGLTSHDVVARARRLLGTRRVGHAGTLDPLATGVLLLLWEEATKLSPFLTAGDKGYLAHVAFGVGTPTLDAEGPVEERADAGGLSAGQVEAAFPAFLAMSEQRPPAYSAVKRGGVKGYEAARRGEELDLPPRAAGYRGIELLAFGPLRDLPRAWREEDGAWVAADVDAAAESPAMLDPDAPAAVIALTVQAGTYVRAFARDLGAALGLPAHLAALRRTRAGAVSIDQVVPLESLGRPPLLDPVALLPMPKLVLDAEAARRVRDGQRLPAAFEGQAALLDPDGLLVAVAEAREGLIRPLRVWRGPL